MVVGLLAITIGIAITAGTHEAAVQSGGGHYIVAYGPIAFGIVSVWRGLKALAS